MAKRTRRDDDIAKRPAIKKKLMDVFADVEKGFTDQRERSDAILDNWDAYSQQLSDRQFYNGNSQLFVPLIHDAVEARVTRFVNQIFPQSGRYVEVTTVEEEQPNALMALLEHYVDRVKLRTEVMPALLRAGDNEGMYNLYVDWAKVKRFVASRVKQPVKVDGLEQEAFGHVETVEEEEIEDALPLVEIVPDADLLVLPVTVNTIEEALETGGSATVLRRWSKGKIRQMIESGDFDKEAGEALIKNMSAKDRPSHRETAKNLADAAGIKTGSGGKFALGYETWVKLKVDGNYRLCRAYYGGEDQILGCKINPYWCDRVPLICAPVEKMPGVFKGRPPVAAVLDLQILANDTINEGADTAHYAAMPIIATDPEKNPRLDSMVLGLAAVWSTSPKDTQFMQFPELWKDALTRVGDIKAQIFQTLGVNPSMVPQSSSSKRKSNQAEIANEQQVDILTTANAVTNLEVGILSPFLQRVAAYDHQFRDQLMTVRVYGEFGLAAQMEQLEPIQLNDRYLFRWLGVESARNAARLQQQIAGMNVIKQIPPNLIPGYRLNLAPLVVQMAESLFGPRLSRLVLEDMRKQLSVDPELENQMLAEGLPVAVHPGDDDNKHLQAHMQVLQGGDPHGTIRVHLQQHQQQMQAKVAAAAQAQQQQQGGGGGGPAAGGQVGQARGVKGPPGMINEDRMPSAGAVPMPRKT